MSIKITVMQGVLHSLECFTIFTGVNHLYTIIAAVHIPVSFCSCRA